MPSLRDAVQAVRSNARAWLPYAMAITLGLVVGWWSGATARDEATKGSPDWWLPPAERLRIAVELGVLALLLVAGLLAIRSSWRRAAVVVFGAALALGVGAVAGSTLGSDHRIWREVPGTVSLRLDPPVARTLTGPARCRTLIDDESVVSVEAVDIVSVAGQRLGAILDVDPRDATGSREDASRPSMVVTLDGRVAYRGRLSPITSLSASAGSSTFAVGFVSNVPDLRLGGPGGPQRLAGRASWTCGDRPPSTTDPP